MNAIALDADRGVARTQPDRKVHTLDARGVRKFAGGWTATLERMSFINGCKFVPP